MAENMMGHQREPSVVRQEQRADTPSAPSLTPEHARRHCASKSHSDLDCESVCIASAASADSGKAQQSQMLDGNHLRGCPPSIRKAEISRQVPFWQHGRHIGRWMICSDLVGLSSLPTVSSLLVSIVPCLREALMFFQRPRLLTLLLATSGPTVSLICVSNSVLPGPSTPVS